MDMFDLCQEINNFFEYRKLRAEIEIDEYGIKIKKTQEPIPDIQDGQYIRIIGSVFNDGVYRMGEPLPDFKPEIFDGAIWYMAVPPKVIALLDEISDWCSENKAVLNSPYMSESFGGYAYNKGSGNASSSGEITWQSHFKSYLNKWRKLR